MTSLLDEVRSACARVSAESRHVRIDADRLADYALALPPDDELSSVASKYYFTGTDEQTAAYVLTFTAINFSSGWNPHLRKLPESSGSITLMSLLRRHFESGGSISPERLGSIRPEQCGELFEQSMEPPVGELMSLFAQAWNDLGQLLCERHGSSFLAFVEAAGHSAERLAELLLDMLLFRDVADYHGFSVPLLKRAQIASADLAAAFGSEGPGRFDDLDRLTIFPDNLVPHVLRLDGVLQYEQTLVDRIAREELLAHGAEEEVEIRAVAVHAVEQLVAACREHGRHLTAAQIDDWLWLKGQGAAYKAVPRHRCRNPHY